MLSLHERSLTPEKAKLGIGLLWTHPAARHKGIATLLVHAARNHAIFECKVSRHHVAFSSPTQAGYNFAVHYSNNNDTNGNRCNNFNGNCRNNQEQEEDSCRRGPLVYEMHLL